MSRTLYKPHYNNDTIPFLARKHFRRRSAPAGVSTDLYLNMDPLWTMTRRKRPLDLGETMCQHTDDAPALFPNSVTLSGSPPKRCMYFLTHWRASRWSSRPMLPWISSSPFPVYRKPSFVRNPSKIRNIAWTVKNAFLLTVTCCRAACSRH